MCQRALHAHSIRVMMYINSYLSISIYIHLCLSMSIHVYPCNNNCTEQAPLTIKPQGISGQVTCKIKTVEIQNSRDSTCTHRLRRSWSDSDGVARHHTPSRGMIPPPTPAPLSAFHIKKKIQKVESTVALKTTRFSDQNA